MDRCLPGSRTSRRAGRRCCSRRPVMIELVAWHHGSCLLDHSAIGQGKAITLPVRNRQLRPDSRPLFLKTRSSHFSFELHIGATNHNKARVIATRTEDSHQSSDIPWIELIVTGVCAPT